MILTTTTTTTALYNKTAIKRAKDNSPFLGFTIFFKKKHQHKQQKN